MKLRSAVTLTVVAACAVTSAWVLVPPYPAPSALIGVSYATIVNTLGPPAGSIPDKFVAWLKPRGVATWSLEVSFGKYPPAEDAAALGASRCLWVKWAGVTVLCLRAEGQQANAAVGHDS